MPWDRDAHRGSRHERGYGRAWERQRSKALRRDKALCQPCQRRGILTPDCREVDHIVSKAQGGTDDIDNLQTICTPCHRSKTARERTGSPDVGCDVSGVPLDPAHPWNAAG